MEALTMSLRFETSSGILAREMVKPLAVRDKEALEGEGTPESTGGVTRATPPQATTQWLRRR